MSRASLKRRARFLHAKKQKGRIRIIQNTLAPVERKPDGTLYRMTLAQHREAKKIIRRLCSNYCDGNCIRLDKEEVSKSRWRSRPAVLGMGCYDSSLPLLLKKL